METVRKSVVVVIGDRVRKEHWAVYRRMSQKGIQNQNPGMVPLLSLDSRRCYVSSQKSHMLSFWYRFYVLSFGPDIFNAIIVNQTRLQKMIGVQLGEEVAMPFDLKIATILRRPLSS
nr:hypothetical protein Iba_chr04eCG6400 [Ipomoea batatas]